MEAKINADGEILCGSCSLPVKWSDDVPRAGAVRVSEDGKTIIHEEAEWCWDGSSGTHYYCGTCGTPAELPTDVLDLEYL